MFTLSVATEILTAVCATSIDTFCMAFTYGTNNIKIPKKSCLVIHAISTTAILLSYLMGIYLASYISPTLTATITFCILLLIGMAKTFDSLFKRILLKSTSHKKEISFSLMSLNFILSVYADPNIADTDFSKSLSVKEAVILAITLSLDNLPIGISLGLSGLPVLSILFFMIITEIAVLQIGLLTGRRITINYRHDISWLGGILLILLAFTKII